MTAETSISDRKGLLTLAVIGNFLITFLLGFLAKAAFFPLTHGITMLRDSLPTDRNEEAVALGFLGGAIVAFSVLPFAFFAALAVLSFISAHRIAARRNFTFVLMVAAVQCLFVPLGTALGVFTLWLIHQDEVKPQFRS